MGNIDRPIEQIEVGGLNSTEKNQIHFYENNGKS